jgi:hypothetical protein
MKIHSLTKYLPEDIVKHIISFTRNIVVRRGVIHIIDKINKELYKDSYSLLEKKPLITETRTTHYNSETYTWCTVRLWNYKNPHITPYVTYSSKNDEFIYKFNIWAKGGLYRETTFIMP